MVKILIVCIVLCILIIVKVQALKKAVFTEKLRFKARNPFVVENGGHLYSLILKNATHVQTYSFNNDIQSCTYDLERSLFKDIRPGILQVVQFGSTTTVAGLGVRNQITEDGYRERVYDLIWFELNDCQERMLKKVFIEKLPASYSEYLPQLVVYQKTFDLFSIGNKECSPCRYNKLGLRVPLNDQLKLEAGRHVKSFHLRSVQKKILDQFLYTCSFQNGTSVIKLLGPYYRVIRQRYVDDPINAVTVNKDICSLFGICYVTSNSSSFSKVYCELLDISLNTIHNLHLPIPKKNLVLNLTISLDASGNTFVSVIQSSLNDRRHSKWLVLYCYDRYGQLKESLDFGDIGRRRGHYEPDAFTRLESYFVDDQYCLVVYEEFGYYALNHRLHIRCIKVPKDYRN